MAEPSHEPKHRASVELVTAAFSTGGSVIVTEAVDVHPIPSVMATLNDPAHNPIAVGFVWALGSDHKYIKGEVPPDIDAVAWPVHTPKHDKLLSTTADATPPHNYIRLGERVIVRRELGFRSPRPATSIWRQRRYASAARWFGSRRSGHTTLSRAHMTLNRTGCWH